MHLRLVDVRESESEKGKSDQPAAKGETFSVQAALVDPRMPPPVLINSQSVSEAFGDRPFDIPPPNEWLF